MNKPLLTTGEAEILWEMIQIADIGNPTLILALTGHQRSFLSALTRKGYVALSDRGHEFTVLTGPAIS